LDVFGCRVGAFCVPVKDSEEPDHMDLTASDHYGGISDFEILPVDVRSLYHLNDTFRFFPRYEELDDGSKASHCTLYLVEHPYRETNILTGWEDEKIIVLRDLARDTESENQEEDGFDIAIVPGKGKKDPGVAYGRRDLEDDWVKLPESPTDLLITAALKSIIAKGCVYRDPDGRMVQIGGEENLGLETVLPPLEGKPVRWHRGWWPTKPKLRDRRNEMKGGNLDFWLHDEAGLLWQGTSTEWTQATCRNCRA